MGRHWHHREARPAEIIPELARISHQAAWNTDSALVLWSKARMTRNTVCSSSEPITVQAGLRVGKPALHSNRGYSYAFRSRAALSNTSPDETCELRPAPAPVILVRNAGQGIYVWI